MLQFSSFNLCCAGQTPPPQQPLVNVLHGLVVRFKLRGNYLLRLVERAEAPRDGKAMILVQASS